MWALDDTPTGEVRGLELGGQFTTVHLPDPRFAHQVGGRDMLCVWTEGHALDRRTVLECVYQFARAGVEDFHRWRCSRRGFVLLAAGQELPGDAGNAPSISRQRHLPRPEIVRCHP